MANLPTMAARNALAFLGLSGQFPSHTHYKLRGDCYPFYSFVYDDERRRSTGRYFELNDAGNAVAARSNLKPCLDYLTERGFALTERKGGRAKAGYMPFVNRATGQTAFISSGRRVYLNVPGKIGAELVYEAGK